jgi:hypothetical protein
MKIEESNEPVIDREAEHFIDSLGLQLVKVLDKARQVTL